MNRTKSRIALLVASVAFADVAIGGAAAFDLDSAVETAMSMTNRWGVSPAEFRAAASESVPFLATNGTDAARSAFRDWYAAIADLPIPSGTDSEAAEWLAEQALLLRAYAGFAVDAQCTNAWIAAARRLGELRNATPSVAEMRNAVRKCVSTGGGETNFAEARAAALRDQERAFALQQAADIVAYAVVDVFGTKGIPLLPESQRTECLEEIVKSGRLTATERAKITNAVERRARCPQRAATRQDAPSPW